MAAFSSATPRPTTDPDEWGSATGAIELCGADPTGSSLPRDGDGRPRIALDAAASDAPRSAWS